MLLVLVFCINLFLLHSSVCVEYSCYVEPFYKNDGIQLIESNVMYSKIYNKLNKEFIKKCQHNYKISPLNVDDPTFWNTQAQLKKYKNVINLYVPDYYTFEKPNEDIVFAGEVNSTDQDTCVASRENPKRFICKAKVVSKNVYEVNSRDLYNFVTSIILVNGTVHSRHSCYNVYENATQLKTILLCLDEEPDENIVIQMQSLKVVISMDCRGKLRAYNNNFLAVLAPKPFEIDTDYNLVPILFYETPYLSPQDEGSFVNSVTLLPWQLLKYVYLEFLRSMGWHRVVILSDDSLYSIEFEYELTQLFNEEKIVYTVLRCEKAECNMAEAKRRLITVGATIVIANLEKNTAETLLSFTYKLEIVWLVRDLTIYELKNIQRTYVFSFTLGSTHSKTRCYKDLILDGITRISRAYKNLDSTDFELEKPKFYRKLAELMKKQNPERNEVIGFVRRASDLNYLLQVLINNDGVKKVINFKSPFEGKVSDGVNCIMRSYNYFQPCEDELILLFMFVIILFSTTILLITCYFHKTSPFHAMRYSKF